MKKSLLIAGIAAAVMLSSSMSFAAVKTNSVDTKTQTPCEKPMQPKDFKDFKGPKKDKMNRPNIDERLKLTEEQKQKAHEIRMNGHKKMKPVFEKMMAKKDEIKKVQESDIAQDKKDKQIENLKADLRKLKQEARKIRMENTKEFEAILTPEQKTEFEKVKKEGKERAKQKHKHKHHCPKDEGAKPIKK